MSFLTSAFGRGDGEVQGTLGHRVALKLIGELRQDRATERQVAEVSLERREARHRAATKSERWNAIRDHLFGLREDLENRPAQRLKRAALGLLDGPQILVDLRSGHRNSLEA